MQDIGPRLQGVQLCMLKPAEFPTWSEAASKDHIPSTMVFFAPDCFGTSQYVSYFGLAPDSRWAKRAGAATDPSLVLQGVPAMLADALKSSPENSRLLQESLVILALKQLTRVIDLRGGSRFAELERSKLDRREQFETLRASPMWPRCSSGQRIPSSSS